ncbi:putative ARM-like repeat-containing protein [Beauveria bassiana]|nr:putative ARM-like repeat-containing protein [Beauveria bassiana]KAH8718657.1 putative ARM-like repeat-containing protein [Beauveria bassiana]
MAKSRRNRAAARKDPLAKPVKPPSDPELAALREAKILPVIKDLKSTDTKKRTAAASAISNIIQDAKCRKLLLREQVVHTVLNETITDTALESRAAGWGILQVLAQEEESDFCIHLFRLDVLTAIEYASKNFTARVTAAEPKFSKLPKAEQSTIISILASLLSLITALAEAGDNVLNAIASNATLTQLLAVLITKHDDISGEFESISTLRTDALACLMLLCEDNDKLAQAISVAGNHTFETLLSLKDRLDGDGVLACAVLHNIFASLEASADARLPAEIDDSVLIPTLTKVLASYYAEEPAAAAGESWSDPAQYQQLALETLASIGTSLSAVAGGPVEADKAAAGKHKAPTRADGEDAGEDQEMDEADDVQSHSGDEGMGDEEDEDEMTQEEIQADMDMVLGDDDDENIEHLPVLQALVQKALPELIRIAASQPSNEVAMAMQGHALSALNNIAWSLSVVDFADSHNAGILAAWSPAAKSIWAQVITPILASDTADLGLATQVTGLSWAIARALRSNTPLQPGEQRKFITLYQATRGSSSSSSSSSAEQPQTPDEDPFQSLGVKCIGVVGQLAMDPCPADTNRELGTFLVTVVSALPQTAPAEAVEALNQLFDIYGEEDYAYDASVFWANNFVKHLEEAVPKARAMAKSVDKKTQAELRLRADEAVMNLTRFIAYKNKNKPKN